ncbi:SusC/RagA family TonB-linked outer membrane protein [Pedobacter boryungensis]|uniref:TonB-dependent receptor n=1 Tax=Pedobacter boryungensis TaxID=869962 RepID=A0ABX2DEJ5_9SPHI|nr:TonB-dependent receptor [Pedobacter boryungensis]NQX32521.1 TonB-dependent receptor [Pedobacter boryungensis]
MKKIFTKFSVLIFLCFLLINVANAQNVTVKGIVKDDAGLTVPGASVIVKGTSNGVQTDVNGNYSISAPSNGTLVFTYIGFTSQEISINGRTTINVDLKSSTNDLQQVVVVGYGTQKKRDLTGSIASVKGEEIEKLTATNPINALQGKVPGLTITNNGAPGSSPTVRIRGINSTGGAVNPLYIVDGQMQENIDYLNPADIESIDVLKDVSSVAIYGLKGANGVIAVTTKKAARGKTLVSFSSAIGIQRVNDKIAMTDADGFKKLYSAQLANLNAAPFDYTNYTANTNWQDLIFRNAVINTNNLSISNSGEKSTTLINLGYNNQDGVMKYSNYKKFIARLNEEIRITEKIKIGTNLTGFHWRNEPNTSSITNALWAAPIVGVQTNGLYNSMPSFQRAQVGNPVYSMERNRNTSINRGYRISGNLYAEVKFLKDFTLSSTVYTDLGFNNSRSYSPLPYRTVNLGEGTAATETVLDNSIRTTVSQSANEYRKYQQDHIITYNKEINGGHKITAVGGFNSVFESYTTLSGSRRDTTVNVPNNSNLWYLGVINQNNPTFNGGGGEEESNAGVFLRTSYSYKDKYLFNGTIRRDGNSKLANQNRWQTFGSIGLGWVASEEDFFKDNIKGIDFLKFRGAYGSLGNGGSIPNNLFEVGLTTASNAIFGDQIYTALGNAYLVNPNLGYEKIKGFDFGFDLKALNNKLSAEINYFNKKTEDLLTTYTLPGPAGNYTYYDNLGTVTNKGIEVSLGWSDKLGKDFSYSINPNFSYTSNKVVSIGNSTNFLITNGINVTETGKSIGYFRGYKQVGIYQSAADMAKMPVMAGSQIGDIAYQDINGDGVITDQDRTYLGSPFPPYSYGLSITLNYKGFDATIDGQGFAGHKIYTQRRTQVFATLNYEANRLNAWTTPGSTNVEPILDNTRANNFLFSNYFIEPGDYFRLRNVQLGYTFDRELLSKIGVSKLRLFLSGQNIKTWSKTTGYSPEAIIGNPTSSGADNGLYPITSVYTFGLNVTF